MVMMLMMKYCRNSEGKKSYEIWTRAHLSYCHQASVWGVRFQLKCPTLNIFIWSRKYFHIWMATIYFIDKILKSQQSITDQTFRHCKSLLLAKVWRACSHAATRHTTADYLLLALVLLPTSLLTVWWSGGQAMSLILVTLLLMIWYRVTQYDDTTGRG